MDWMSILVSEAIGIAVTVLIIDRLLSWRERHRWREARELLVGQAKKACNEIIDAWKEWLLDMAKEARDNKLSEADRNWLLEMGYYALGDKSSLLAPEIDLGKPVGSRLDEFATFCDSERIDEMIKRLVPYLAKKVFPQGHPAWSRLHKEIDPPVGKLSDMVDRYSTVVDPKLLQQLLGSLET